MVSGSLLPYVGIESTSNVKTDSEPIGCFKFQENSSVEHMAACVPWSEVRSRTMVSINNSC